jgi:hypothetical protein
MHIIITFALILLLTGCNNSSSINQTSYKIREISARDDGVNKTRPTIYRAKIPSDWICKDPELNISLSDTTKSICELFILNANDNDQKIRITIHNFPSLNPDDRIPSTAQIARWKKQFSQLDPSSISIISQSFAGFSGQLFEGSGLLNGEEISIMAWSMQLAQEHYSILSLKLQLLQANIEKQKIAQMKSDFTIKATGPKALMEKHRRDIFAFARSFELIEEIPSAS